MNEPLEPGQWRTARKAHVCHGCGQPITAGSRYWEYFGATPTFLSGHRFHPEHAAGDWYGAKKERMEVGAGTARPEAMP